MDTGEFGGEDLLFFFPIWSHVLGLEMYVGSFAFRGLFNIQNACQVVIRIMIKEKW